MWIPVDKVLSDGSLLGIIILLFPLVYTIGIVTDRLVDSLYDRWFCNRIIISIFDPAAELETAEEGRRIGLIRKMEMSRLIFLLQKCEFVDNLPIFFRTISGGIAFTMIAKLTPSPITAPRRQIR